ncbi:MAG: sigma-70 family RNA polymerase sigma factor [Planctomycetota bacterium]|nr:MAG: sigma-70 family RNA polymerase sigma factor [Planctomycetota bacterium]
MVLSEIDRHLLQRCLERKPRAWEDFVDRFLGLVVHVVNHSAQARSIRLSDADRDDLCAEVFLTLVRDDFAVLRHFRGQCSLATYLTVVARRVVVRELLRRNKTPASLSDVALERSDGNGSPERRIENREEVERLLRRLDGPEATIVRMYHLEGRSYKEIAQAVGLPANSIGPILSRARNRLRRLGSQPTS